MAALAEMPTAATATTTSSRVEAAEAGPGRTSSMEWEPKTLTLNQIKFAREAALYVVSTKTEEEAIRIFTEGLKPVQMTVRKSSSTDSSSDDDVDLGYCCCSAAGDSSTKGCCGGGSKGGRRGRRQRRHSILMDDDRDVATAPF